MNLTYKLGYALLSLRAWRYFVIHPVFTCRIALARIAFTFTRRFCFGTITSPSGEKVYNVQSLINHWAMHVVGEFGSGWQNKIRETVAPSVWDVGANIGQFGRLIMDLNPGARVIAIDPWPGMERYNTHAKLLAFACGDQNCSAILTKASGEGWTGSTSDGFYNGDAMSVNMVKLDDMWDGLPVDLLKIDVDGAEKMIGQTRVIIVEVNSYDAPGCLPVGFNWSTVNGHDWVGIRSDWHRASVPEIPNTKAFKPWLFDEAMGR